MYVWDDVTKICPENVQIKLIPEFSLKYVHINTPNEKTPNNIK